MRLAEQGPMVGWDWVLDRMGMVNGMGEGERDGMVAGLEERRRGFPAGSSQGGSGGRKTRLNLGGTRRRCILHRSGGKSDRSIVDETH